MQVAAAAFGVRALPRRWQTTRAAVYPARAKKASPTAKPFLRLGLVCRAGSTATPAIYVS